MSDFDAIPEDLANIIQGGEVRSLGNGQLGTLWVWMSAGVWGGEEGCGWAALPCSTAAGPDFV